MIGRVWMTVAALLVAAAPATAADVSVTLTGVKAKGGTVRVALYDEKTFMATAPFNAEAKGDKAGDVTVVFADVPPGDYVVAAFHDANDDRAMGMAGGRMTEGNALSRAEALRGAPSFAANRVPVPATGTRLAIAMSYPEDRRGW